MAGRYTGDYRNIIVFCGHIGCAIGVLSLLF